MNEKNILNNEVIDHPDYYFINGKEAIDVIEDFNANFSEGCIIKYLWRHGRKNDEEQEKDDKKAVWYFDREANRIFKIYSEGESKRHCYRLVYMFVREVFIHVNSVESIEPLTKHFEQMFGEKPEL